MFWQVPKSRCFCQGDVFLSLASVVFWSNQDGRGRIHKPVPSAYSQRPRCASLLDDISLLVPTCSERGNKFMERCDTFGPVRYVVEVNISFLASFAFQKMELGSTGLHTNCVPILHSSSVCFAIGRRVSINTNLIYSTRLIFRLTSKSGL